MTKQRLILLISAVAFVVVLAYAFRPQPIAAEVVHVTRGPLQVSISNQGRTRIKERYLVSAPLHGRLLRVNLRPGDPVAAGKTVLTAIQPSDAALLDPRARAEAEARVKATDAARQRAVPILERVRATAELAKVELERAQRLMAEGAMSRQELDNAELKAHTAQEDLRAAEFALQIAEFEFEQASAVLNGARHSPNGDDSEFEIRSPVDGVLLRVFQQSATVVSAGTLLLEVGDPEDLEVEIDVLSTDAVRIKPGHKVLLEHWGGDGPLEARVRVVEPAAFLKVSALGVEEQRVLVIADFVGTSEQRRGLGDGYRVEARVITSEDADVLKIPIGSLFREQGRWAVFAEQNGRAVLRPVQIGRRNDAEAEILDGINQGESVVLHPSDKIRADVRIKPLSSR
jgi:HlyD family secretion protein